MSIYDKNDGVNEETLFAAKKYDDGVSEEILNRGEERLEFVSPVRPIEINDGNYNGDGLGSETLFSGEEQLDFVKPIKPIEDSVSDYDGDGLGSEALFGKKEISIAEEDLSGEIYSVADGVESEALFKDDNGKLTLEGEEISFAEPYKAVAVEEETLFSDDESVDETAVNAFENSGDIFDDSLILDVLTVEDDKKTYVDKNFPQKMLEADAEIIERYVELKNVILSYKKVKSRISNNFDSFNMGRTQLFKLCTTGKSLKLYLNLNYDEVETRLKCKYAGDKKAYAEVPVLLRIKSPRAFKNAKYLIQKVAERFNLQQNSKFVPVDGVALLKQKYQKQVQDDDE